MTAPTGIRRHPFATAAVLIALAAVAVYLAPVFMDGWYYDDWRILAEAQDAPSSGIADIFNACSNASPGGRVLVCLPQTVMYAVLGPSAPGFHAAAIVLVALTAFGVFMLLRRIGLPLVFALGVALLYIVYPGSDATRLWPTGVGAQWVMAGYLGGVLLALRALRSSGWRAVCLHVVSAAIFIALFLMNEAVVSVVAVTAIFYLAADVPTGRALRRGVADLALALGFLIARFTVLPVPEGTGFVQGRTLMETVERMITILEGAWRSSLPLFTGNVGLALLGLGIAAAVVASYRRPEAHRAIRRWVLVCGASALFACAAVLAYTLANDFYVPDPDSLFNRLNLMAAPAYCALFAGLVALLHETARQFIPRAVATALAAALVVLAVIGLEAHSLWSQESYAESWRAQKAALAGIEKALADGVPADADLVTFGHPIWEEGFVPVFASGWDVRGAIDFTTDHDPLGAIPALPGSSCGPTAFLAGGAPFADYRGDRPLWFLDVATGTARDIKNRADCERAFSDWGEPPFWGRTVTGGV